MIPIREDYRQYAPPRWVTPTIERLIRSLPPAHLNGLAAVVLTDSRTLDGRKGRRARSQRRVVASGVYHPRRAGNQAWIEIAVDRVMPELGHLGMFQWARDIAFASVLFHEVGHHLNATVGSQVRGEEAGAVAWERRLSGLHLARRYWFLRFRPVVSLLWRFSTMMAKRSRVRRGLRKSNGVS